MEFIKMEIFPKISIVLSGGWILTVIYLLVNIGLPLSKKGSLKRLLTPSKQYTSFNEKMFYVFSQLSWFVTLFLPIIYPIKINLSNFIPGIIIYTIGTLFTILSLHSYIYTPLNQPVKKGIYQFSRNPIYASYNILGFGIAILTGSWIIFIVHIIEIFTCHFMVLDEEKYCIEKYGYAYQTYMQKVPRYYFGKI